MISIDSDKIAIKGHVGTWHVIDQLTDHRGTFYLLEHDTYGDEAASLIVLRDGTLVLEDVYNGFSDLDDMPEKDIARIRVSYVIRELAAQGCLFMWSESNKSVIFPVEAVRALSVSDLRVAEDILIEQGIADQEKNTISLARAVDEYYMNRDPYGYGDSFDIAQDFNDVELRVARMKGYLEDPNGLSQVIESLQSDLSADMDPQELSIVTRLNERLMHQAHYLHEHPSVSLLTNKNDSFCDRDEEERER